MSKLQLPDSMSFPFDLTFDKKYYIVVKKSALAAEACDGCNGEGRITLEDGGKYRCPKCGGEMVLYKPISDGYHIETLSLRSANVATQNYYFLVFSDGNYTLQIEGTTVGDTETQLCCPCAGVQLCDICKHYAITDNIIEAQNALKEYEEGTQNDE